MRYLLLVYGNERDWEAKPVDQRAAVFRAAHEYGNARRAGGFYETGEPLEPTRTATTVRMKGGKAVMTDGPFAETKEQLAGYTIIDAANLDEALAFVARHPLTEAGFSIEVRPIRVGPPR